MGRGEYVDRLRSDFKKTFKTTAGKHVLMHLYTHLGGHMTSYKQGCNGIDIAFNEGKRLGWLVIQEQLKNMDDIEARRLLAEHLAERRREEEM